MSEKQNLPRWYWVAGFFMLASMVTPVWHEMDKKNSQKYLPICASLSSKLEHYERIPDRNNDGIEDLVAEFKDGPTRILNGYMINDKVHFGNYCKE